MEEKKGRVSVMAELAVLAIWFASVIAGMVLTMLMPHIFPDLPAHQTMLDKTAGLSSPANGVCKDEGARVRAHEVLPSEVFQGRRTSMVLIEERGGVNNSAHQESACALRGSARRHNERLIA